ncbi:MAG: nucleotidyltransferase family protein [Ktedonobacterales bacterium]
MVRQIVETLRRHGVLRAGIFGSFARGEADETSDVDLLIDPPPEMSLFGLARLGNELEAALDHNVDLITCRSLHPRFREAVLKEQVSILGLL